MVKIEGATETFEELFKPEPKILSILDNIEINKESMTVDLKLNGYYLEAIDKNMLKVKSSILGDVTVRSIKVSDNGRELNIHGYYLNNIPTDVESIDFEVEYKGQKQNRSYNQAVIKSISSIREEGDLLKISIEGKNLQKIDENDLGAFKLQILENQDIVLNVNSIEKVSNEQINLYATKSSIIEESVSIIEVEYNKVKLSYEFKQPTFTGVDSIYVNGKDVEILLVGENLELFTKEMLSKSTITTSNPEIVLSDLKLSVINNVRIRIEGTLSKEITENKTVFTFTSNRGTSIDYTFVQATIENIKDQKVISRNQIQITLIGKNLELLDTQKLLLTNGENKFVIDQLDIQGKDVLETTIIASLVDGKIDNELSTFDVNVSYLSYESTITFKQSVIKTIEEIQIDSISDEATIKVLGENFDLLRKSGENFVLEINPTIDFEHLTYEVLNNDELLVKVKLSSDITNANTMFTLTYNEKEINKIYRQAIITQITNPEVLNSNQIKFTIVGENLELFNRSKMIINGEIEIGSFIIDEISFEGYELTELTVTATTQGTIRNTYSKFEVTFLYGSNIIIKTQFKQAVLKSINSIDVNTSNLVTIEIEGDNLDLIKDLSLLSVSLPNNKEITVSDIAIERVEDKTFVKAQLSAKITNAIETFKVTYNRIEKSFDFKQAVVRNATSMTKIINDNSFQIQLEGENLELIKKELVSISYKDFIFEVQDLDNKEEAQRFATITVVSNKTFDSQLPSLLINFAYDGSQSFELEYRQAVMDRIEESSFKANESQLTFTVSGQNFDVLEDLGGNDLKNLFSLDILRIEKRSSKKQYSSTIENVQIVSETQFIYNNINKHSNSRSCMISLTFKGKIDRAFYEPKPVSTTFAQVSWFKRIFKKY